MRGYDEMTHGGGLPLHASEASPTHERECAYYDYPISIGPLEATKNMIKDGAETGVRFPRPDLLHSQDLPLHLTTYALVG